MDEAISLEEIDIVIDRLKEENKKNSFESYTYIKNLIHKFNIPLPTRLVPNGRRVGRCRLHRKNEEFFPFVADISYRKDFIDIKSFGRGNEPAQAMFYCSDSQKLSFIETSIITRDNNLVDLEVLTTGVWEVENPLTVVNILANDSIKGRNKIVDEMHRDFESFISEAGNSGEVLKRFLTFISEEFTREAKGNSSNYKISCAFTNYVYNMYPYIDGVMFPSSMYPEDGVNFILWPETVDKKLKFISARREKMKRIGEVEYIEIETINCKEESVDSEKLEW
jgi:hypothetical protein